MNSLTPIHDFLLKNANKGEIRAYMPGHKGYENPLDITEIKGADSLYEAEFFSDSPGIIAQSEKIASGLFSSVQTLYSCSGSTLAIQTMLALAKENSPGKRTVVAGRYSHRSFINSCILLDIMPRWVYPKSFISAEITPSDIENAIDDDTFGVFINSIDYYGGMSDIKGISEVCRKKGVFLLVDNAHGAYLSFLPGMHPISLGADMCADSAHKTLSVLTGGAYLHIGNKLFCNNAKNVMALFGSSSPSYLILDSLDRFNKTATENKDRVKIVSDMVKGLKDFAADMGYSLYKSDPFKLTINCLDAGYTGNEFAALLKEYNIECEYGDKEKCVMLFGWNTEKKDTEHIKSALGDIKKKSPIEKSFYSHIYARAVTSPREAYFKAKEIIPTLNAGGRICAESISPCPPGIPLIMPGENIDNDTARAIYDYGIEKIKVNIS